MGEFDSREHLLQQEIAKAERELRVGHTDHQARLAVAEDALRTSITLAPIDFGPVRHGIAVNEDLHDYVEALKRAVLALVAAKGALTRVYAEADPAERAGVRARRP